MNKYISELSLMCSWFSQYNDHRAKYYEYTMRLLITRYSFDELIKNKKLSDNEERNLIRLIEDNKLFIEEHLKIILSLGE